MKIPVFVFILFIFNISRIRIVDGERRIFLFWFFLLFLNVGVGETIREDFVYVILTHFVDSFGRTFASHVTRLSAFVTFDNTWRRLAESVYVG
jgi:hypothetical protein